MTKLNYSEIEKKWQKYWQENGVNKTSNDFEDKPKFYILDMFPYPSGEGLHVGHPKGYIATDVYSRMKKMQGYNVLHPMGWDAFGLPAEQFAIKNKINPNIATEKNVKRYKEQIEMLGINYDWDREINTTDPKYYKWTQWMFKQMYKDGLAHESFEPINWCPSCKTGLANEDLDGNVCERCGTIVEKKPLRQWVIKITDYADRLLADLDKLDWEPHIKELQRNWIGKSEGSEIDFKIQNKIIYGHDLVTDFDNGKVEINKDGSDIPRPRAVAIIRIKGTDKFIGFKNLTQPEIRLAGGGVEVGESSAEAAEREAAEEIGIKGIKYLGHLASFRGHENYELFEIEKDYQIYPSELDEEGGKLVEFTREEILKNNWVQVSYIFEHLEELSKNKIPNSLKIFTTRADTLYGCTFMCISYTLAKEWIKNGWEASEEIKNFIEKLEKEEKERTIDFDMSKLEKEGIDTGVKAINPANGEEVPIYIANYILSDYGTGAIMAVPAHDERDYEFAKKYNIEIRDVISQLCGEKLEDSKEVFGSTVIAYDPSKKLFLKMENKDKENKPWLPCGGVTENESYEECAIRELKEEAGISKIDKIIKLGSPIISYYFNPNKNSNRKSIGYNYLVFLDSTQKVEQAQESHENFEIKWVTYEDLLKSIIDAKIGAHWVAALERVKNYLDNNIEIYESEGILLNSREFSGMTSEEARVKITEKVGGKIVSKYKLKDWVFARQRYWGEPFPIVFDENKNSYVVADKELPVVLPNVENYEPTDTGESPLANIRDWVEVYGFINDDGEFESLDKNDNRAKLFYRETNTMPQWAGSSWYYLRYIDPQNDEMFVDKELEKKWSPVDFYVGGAEHATRHLIYARFWHKFLFDKGYVNYDEPFSKLQTVGLIMAEDGKKMSKRYNNVVNPDDVVREYGADAMRTYEMFMGPFEKSIAWNTNSMAGVSRFLERVYSLVEKISLSPTLSQGKGEVLPLGEDLGGADSKEVERVINETIKKVGDDIEKFGFNTAIAQLMICLNTFEEEIKKGNQISKNTFEKFVKVLSPFAVHISEEIYQNILDYKNSIHLSDWPKYDEEKIKKDEIEMSIQISGKFRGTFTIKPDSEDEEVKKEVKNTEVYKKYITDESQIKKIIMVKNRLINIVI